MFEFMKLQYSNFQHRKSTCNKKLKGTVSQYSQLTLSMGLIPVLSHLEFAQIRISCSGWTILDSSKLVSALVDSDNDINGDAKLTLRFWTQNLDIKSYQNT